MSAFPRAAAAPAAPCPVCGWKESVRAAECRSCGHALNPGRLAATTPPVSTPAISPGPPPVPSGYAARPSPDEISDSPPPAAVPRHRRPVRVPQAPSRSFAAKYAKPLLVTAGLLFLMFRWAGSGPVHHPPGILIPNPPQQTGVPPGKTAWKVGDTVIAPLAAYRINARVLHRERYRWEAMADLAPIDLGVGWDLMSDERHVSQVTFSNSNRFLSWFWNSSDFPGEAATRCMGNMHMLPASDLIRSRLLGLRPGELFQASGYLVQVMRPGMDAWTSSLTRDDTGNGACEIMWVESLTPRP